MDRSWAFDSSTLIILGKIGRLDLVKCLPGGLYIPHFVKMEILAGKDTDPSVAWATGKDCPARVIRSPINKTILGWDLGPGESEVISFALRHRGCFAVLDDRRARRCAKTLSVPIQGTVGLLLFLKKQGNLEKIKPILLSLIRSGFRLDQDVLQNALRIAGEEGTLPEAENPSGVQESRAVYRTRKTKPRKIKKHG